jgi:Mg-chelatase subunit ChlD
MDTDNIVPIHCPITGMIMTDPVQTPSGHSYQREAILQWLEHNQNDPMTRDPLYSNQLTDNRALKDTIEILLQSGQEVPHSVQPQVVDLTQDNQSEEMDIEEDVPIIVKYFQTTTRTNLEVEAPKSTTTRVQPTDIILTIDVSGSMDTDVEVNTGDHIERNGFTRLDIVKYASQTVISSLSDNDRLGIYLFTNRARRLLPLTKMNQVGKQMASQLISEMNPENSTNLYDGLVQSLDEMTSHYYPNRNQAIFLLTDGLPNVDPPQGIIPAFKQYLDNHSQTPIPVFTFGFGYDLDSRTLQEIAFLSRGQYCFSPDASFIGTIFINAISNLLTTYTRNLKVQVTLNQELVSPTYIPELVTTYPHTQTTWGYEVELSSLSIDQKKTIPLDFPRESITGIRVVYDRNGQTNQIIQEQFQEVDGDSQEAKLQAKLDWYRLKALTLVNNSIEQISQALPTNNFYGYQPQFNSQALSQAEHILNEIISQAEMESEITSQLQAFLEDLKGQISQAFSRGDWYQKWGEKFMRSWSMAHLFQYCNNFKDHGVQVYKGELFNLYQIQLNQIFEDLPQPEPSHRGYQYSQVQSMSGTYNNSSNPCLLGDVPIIVVHHRTGMEIVKLFKDLKKGDCLKTHLGIASVRCLIRTKTTKGTAEIVELGDLRITPWHPIKNVYGNWKFPIDMVELDEVQVVETDYVYNIVLNNHHQFLVDDIPVVSLGHNFKGSVVGHPYLGTQQVIDDLSKMPGWDEGLITLDAHDYQRDQVTCWFSGLEVPGENNQEMDTSNYCS